MIIITQTEVDHRFAYIGSPVPPLMQTELWQVVSMRPSLIFSFIIHKAFVGGSITCCTYM